MKKPHPQSMNLVYNVGYTLSRWLATAFFSYRVSGAEHIPSEGGVILASNHCSFLDPPLVGIASRRAMWFLARKTLLDWPLLGPVFPSLNVIPVDRDGNDRTAIKSIVQLLHQGEGVVLFPEGTRSPDGGLQAAKPGLGMIVAKSFCPVVPARIFGSFEAFPKGGGIRPGKISVKFAEPLHFSPGEWDSKSRESYQAISDRVLSAIAAITPPEGTK